MTFPRPLTFAKIDGRIDRQEAAWKGGAAAVRDGAVWQDGWFGKGDKHNNVASDYIVRAVSGVGRPCR